MIREILEEHLDDLIDLYERWCLEQEGDEPEDPELVRRIDAHLDGWVLGGEQSAELLAVVNDQPGRGQVLARYALELKGIEVSADHIPEPDEQIKKHYLLIQDRIRKAENVWN